MLASGFAKFYSAEKQTTNSDNILSNPANKQLFYFKNKIQFFDDSEKKKNNLSDNLVDKDE